jgi:hypothetical protein
MRAGVCKAMKIVASDETMDMMVDNDARNSPETPPNLHKLSIELVQKWRIGLWNDCVCMLRILSSCRYCDASGNS